MAAPHLHFSTWEKGAPLAHGSGGRFRTFLEEWREASGTIQTVVLTLAAVIAGGWAAYAFITTQTARRAQLEVARLESDSRKSATQFSIAVHQGTRLGSRRPLIITVKVSNNGSRNVVIDLSKPRLGMSLVRLESDSVYPRGAVLRYESPDIVRLRDTAVIAHGWVELSPETSTELSYLIIVDRPGLYLIDFQLPVTPERARIADSISKATGLDTAMARMAPQATPEPVQGTSRYIEVR